MSYTRIDMHMQHPYIYIYMYIINIYRNIHIYIYMYIINIYRNRIYIYNIYTYEYPRIARGGAGGAPTAKPDEGKDYTKPQQTIQRHRTLTKY